MWPFIYVAIGGAVGASMRYALSAYIGSRLSTLFPLGTLLVNILGSMLVGFLILKGIQSEAVSSTWRLLLIIGFGGAFTTFSSFSAETLLLLKDGLYLIAIANIAANVVFCLIAAGVGFLLAKII